MGEKMKGVVKRLRLAVGSKSERSAIVLATLTEELILRRKGGNALVDDSLGVLVGKRVTVEGFRHNNTFIFDKVTIL